MKVHRYEITAYEGLMDWTHGMGQTQCRLYFPKLGVLGYRSNEKIDFFSDDKEIIEDAEMVIASEPAKEIEAEYLGIIDMPDNVVSRVISTAKALKTAEVTFQDAAGTLVSLLKE